jgi:hypothetical protein
MGRILFVAELGGGFGHVRRLLPVALAARALGHEPLFLVPNPEEVLPFLSPVSIHVAATPSVAQPPLRAAPAGAVATSFADILGGSGFADATYLAGRVQAWDERLAALRPLAVVCEASPFFNLAALGGALPVLVLGYGFLLPPPHLPAFPPLRDAAPLYDEAALLDNVAQVVRARGRTPPRALPELLAGTAHAVTGLGELDPYRSAREVPPVGPPELETRPSELEPQHELFAYLLGDAPTTLPVLAGLAASGARGPAVVRRGPAAQRPAVGGSGKTRREQPGAIARTLGQAGVVVHHGSMLTCEEALTAGKPQLIVPLYLEHLLSARALLELGTAAVVRAPREPSDIARTLAHAMAPELARRTRAFAHDFWARSASEAGLPRELLGRVVAL